MNFEDDFTSYPFLKICDNGAFKLKKEYKSILIVADTYPYISTALYVYVCVHYSLGGNKYRGQWVTVLGLSVTQI